MENETRKLYQHQEQDNDYQYYWFMNRDVTLYNCFSIQLNSIFSHFERQSEQQLFIKGNYLFFSLNGVKYWKSLTVSSWEWEHIQELIEQLKPLVDNIFYDPGRLD